MDHLGLVLLCFLEILGILNFQAPRQALFLRQVPRVQEVLSPHEDLKGPFVLMGQKVPGNLARQRGL